MKKLLLLFLFFFIAYPIQAATIYVAQASAGANNGTNCANARAVSSLAAGDWVAGNAIHLCGTITSAIVPTGSGSSGNVISVIWESGAQLSVCNISGAVQLGNRSYLLFDLGANNSPPAITCPNNGTGLGTTVQAVAFLGAAPQNIEINNGTVGPMYVHSGTDSGGLNSACFTATNGPKTWHIHHLTMTGCGTGINMSFNNSSSGSFDEFDHITSTSQVGRWLQWASGSAGTYTASALVHDNDVDYTSTYAYTGSPLHYEIAHIFDRGEAGSADVLTIQFYNNYFHGSTPNNSSSTAGLFVGEGAGCAGSGSVTAWIYNNLFKNTAGGIGWSSGSGGFIYDQDCNHTMHVYNNTIDGADNTTDSCFEMNGSGNTPTGVTWDVANNICISLQFGPYNPATPATTYTSDRNIFYNLASSGFGGYEWRNSQTLSIATWRTNSGQDANSQTGSPGLTASYTISSSSSLAHTLGGTNLTSNCSTITALCSGAPQTFGASGSCGTGCIARTASGTNNWDLGAYTFVPPCAKPVISGTTGSSDTSGQQLTLSWNTDIAADSTAIYGYNNAGTLTSTTDTGGVTSHSITIPNLMPGAIYQWGVRSQAISGGVACGTGYIAFDALGDLGHSTTMTAAPAGSFTYDFNLVGASYNTQGYKTYVEIGWYPITGTYTNLGLKFVVTGLPPFSKVVWPDASIASGGYWSYAASPQSTTTVAFDTFTMRDPQKYITAEFELTTNIGGTTPPGPYTLTVTASQNNSSGYATVAHTWPITVVSSSTPFSGVALTPGTPVSYPTIPNLSTYLASADTYGEQSCAQDTDNPRTIRPNTANLVVPALCCTYDSWFYDGVQAYFNVENMLHNGKSWVTCRNNVKQAYRDNWAIPTANYNILLAFSKGYYTDYPITSDAADLTVINKYNTTINPTPWHGAYLDVSYLQRETAYTMRNVMHGVALGQSASVSTFGGLSAPQFRDYAMEHVLAQLDQACLGNNAKYYENFMFGLEAMELLDYYEIVTPDPRIPPAIACLANWMYTNQWEYADAGSFVYDKYQRDFGVSVANGATSCMNTLNNMSSPMFAWLFKYTGDTSWQTKGDAIFSHGVLFDCPSPLPTGPSSYLTMRADSDGKTYSQNYSWGTSYVTWRSAPLGNGPPPANIPSAMFAGLLKGSGQKKGSN